MSRHPHTHTLDRSFRRAGGNLALAPAEMHPNPAAQFCRGFVDLRVPDALQSIGDCAISKCTSGSVGPRLPDALLLSVSNAALCGCSGVVGLRLADTLQSASVAAFGGFDS